MPTKPIRATLAAGAILSLTAATALAHHGWAWTSPEPFVLSGTITDVYIGNPHATMEIEVDGEIWHVDLAPLIRTLDAGFDEEAASVGDSVTLYGHQSTIEGENAMKAVRVEVNGMTYDVYPDRTGPFD